MRQQQQQWCINQISCGLYKQRNSNTSSQLYLYFLLFHLSALTSVSHFHLRAWVGRLFLLTCIILTAVKCFQSEGAQTGTPHTVICHYMAFCRRLGSVVKLLGGWVVHCGQSCRFLVSGQLTSSGSRQMDTKNTWIVFQAAHCTVLPLQGARTLAH